MEPAAAVIYQEQLLKSFKRGMPLYEPESEVHIGDVGYFCEGRFTRLFNVTRPEGDPWQTEMGVPLGFETLEIPLVHRLAIPNYFLPQPLCSRSVRAKEINVELNA